MKTKTKRGKPAVKLDLYQEHKAEYAATKKPALIEVGPAVYLAIRGRGAPGGEAFTAAIGALYGMAFTIKMTRKFSGQQDYGVCKLEGQWWAAEGCDFSKVPREQWEWDLLIRTPDFVTEAECKRAVAVLLKRGKGVEVKEVRRETIAEGQCVQMLYVGPYENEPDAIGVMREFAAGRGLETHGRHHEIYLSDPRRVSPERLRTILRMPLRAKIV